MTERGIEHAVDLAAVAAEILGRPATNGARIVGIDGPSGSGKSTFARALLAQLPGDAERTLVQIDDFVSWPDFAGWWPRFDSEVLQPLSQGRDARYRARDWLDDEFGTSLGEWKVARWAPIIAVEGVTSTRQAAADRLAYAVWVHAPRAVRLRRGIARDGESHRELWLRWMAEEDEFFATDRTRGRADLVIDTA